MSAKATVGNCENCGKRELLSPLHGERGGPLRCIACGMEWHGKYGRRRKLGRIVIKAMKAYMNAGGGFGDFNRLRLAASGFSVHGYDVDTIGAELGDITSELLRDTLRLTHPDCQPPERRELAHRVTQELIALQPFVFPAPTPEPPPEPGEHNTSLKVADDPFEDALRAMAAYPCVDCADAVPQNYCNSCSAEWDKRYQAKHECSNTKQREWYRRRKVMGAIGKPIPQCGVCGARFKGRRKDAKHCSAKCRQKAHRQRKV